MQTNYTRLTFSPKASPASPAVNMFLAALTSRSWVVLHSGQSQWRVSRLKKGKVYPQLQQRLELGKNWSILTKLLPAQSALYSNCLDKPTPTCVHNMLGKCGIFNHVFYSQRFNTNHLVIVD